MGLLAMLLVSVWILPSPTIQVASQFSGSRALDAILQDYAYGAFTRPKTGIAYDGAPPSDLIGIKILAMRLRSGSLKRKGVSAYKEFRIPKGVTVQPRVTRLVLVYHNLGNWSTVYYPLPSGYVYVAPVLGLLAYDGSNLSAKHFPELDVRVSSRPISIQFSVANGSVPRCVWFDLNGSVNFGDIVSGNICSTFQQGHFSVVVESASSTPLPPSPPATGERKNNNEGVGIIIGSVLGGLGLLISLAILALWVYKYRRNKKIEQMENAAEAGEALETTTIGSTRAPSATVTRTQPSVETEYVP